MLYMLKDVEDNMNIVERNDVKNKTAKNKNIISDMKISLQKKITIRH